MTELHPTQVPGPARDAEFIRLWNADATAKQISLRLNIGFTGIHSVAKRLGLPLRGPRTQLMRKPRR